MGPLKHQLFSLFLGGQFGPVCTGQFESVKGGQFQPARVVNLNRILQYSNPMIDQKIDYIHNNQAEAGFVSEAYEWRLSIANLDSPIKTELL